MPRLLRVGRKERTPGTRTMSRPLSLCTSAGSAEPRILSSPFSLLWIGLLGSFKDQAGLCSPPRLV